MTTDSRTHAAWEPYLLNAGYRFGLFDGLNRFYCREEDADLLMPRLSAPANVLDNFRLAREVCALDAAASRADALTLELQTGREELSRLDTALASEKAKHDAARTTLGEEQAAHARTQSALVAEQTAHADTRTALAAERAAHADTRTALAAERTAHADTRAALAAEREAHTATCMALTAERAAHADAHASLVTERAAHTRLHDELAAVYGSTCWRVTAPMRNAVYFSRLLRRAAP